MMLITGPFYLDAHVHVYPCHDEPAMLDAAAANVAGYGDGRGTPALGLTELSACHVFRRWRDAGRVGRWRIVSHGESAVLFAERDDGRRIVVLAGRQIVTEFRIGVLALGVDREFDDGRPLWTSIEQARAAGATTVVSYGMGKWHGHRGRLMDAVVEEAEPGGLGLGDVGARPHAYVQRQLARAAERGLTILPGSDPLVFRRSQNIVGSCCVKIDGAFPAATFGRDFMAHARDIGPASERYGRHVSVGQAIRDQIKMRVVRRKWRRRGLDI
ncbi:MAG: hypothetical protein AAGL98_02040 [Planctomycetota bacterium]